jgi:transposase-like protein
MMGERGIEVHYSTLSRWVQVYGPELERRLRKQPSHLGKSWRVDETYIKVNGEWKYLYRAVDKQGNTVDFRLSEKQDKKAAKAFFEKSLKKPSNPEPETINTDKHAAYPPAIEDLKKEGKIPEDTKHLRVKCLNNIIESDHARFKQPCKPMKWFKTFPTAENTIAGMEAMGMLRKRQFKAMKNYETEVQFVHSLFGITA